MTSRATVYDVAKAAGVSIKTVSRVVNGSEEVSIETRDRVLSAMEQLAYVRNSVAHSLRTGSSDTIGIIVDSISDRFFSMLISVVEERALARGISVLIASTGRSVLRERGQVARLLQQNVGALLLTPTGSDHRYIQETAGKIPVVLIDRGWELSGYDTIRVQDREGARLATEHLYQYGHRRIAFLGEITELETITARRAGYLDGLRENGIETDPALIRSDCGSAADARAATITLLSGPRPPTAIFSSNPRASVGVVSALHSTRRTDVAFVSFGDFDLADALVPAVTVIDQDPAKIAEAAVERVLARMSGEQSEPAQITLPVALIPRGSGELAP